MTQSVYNVSTGKLIETDIVEYTIYDILKKLSIRATSVKCIDNFVEIIFEKNFEREEFVSQIYISTECDELKRDIIGDSECGWIYSTSVKKTNNGDIEFVYGLRFLMMAAYIIIKSCSKELNNIFNEDKITYEYKKKDKDIRTKANAMSSVFKLFHIRCTSMTLTKNTIDIAFSSQYDIDFFINIFLKKNELLDKDIVSHVVKKSCDCHKWKYDMIFIPCENNKCDMKIHNWFIVKIPHDDIIEVASYMVSLHKDLFISDGSQPLDKEEKKKIVHK